MPIIRRFNTNNSPILYQGKGVPLFYADPKKREIYNNGYIKGQAGRNIAKWLFSEAGFSLDMLDEKAIKAFLLKRDEKILNDLRVSLQEVLENVFFHANNNEYNQHFIANKNLQLQSIITAALSIFAFTEPPKGYRLTVPQLINNSWQAVEYEIEPIVMTPCSLGSPYYAYGMKPVNNPPTGAQAHILFMGTNTIPTGRGMHHTFMADTMPGCSVGEHLYLLGKKQIQNWINKAYNETKLPIVSSGQSLGGSMAVLAHTYQPDKVQAKAFNPPAWLLYTLKGTYQHNLHKAKKRYIFANKLSGNLSDAEFLKRIHGTDKPIEIVTQQGDPIFTVGNYIPKTARVWRVSSNIGDNNSIFGRHKDCYASHSFKNNLKFKRIDPNIESSKLSRLLLTIIWQTISVPLAAIHIIAMLLKVVMHYICRAITGICNAIIPNNRHKTASANDSDNKLVNNPMTPAWSVAVRNDNQLNHENEPHIHPDPKGLGTAFT
jgi:hypothetical protein